MKKTWKVGGLFRPAGHVSDSNKRRSVRARETKFGSIGEGHWANSCFSGSRPPGASRNNKTIPYDLYLWALPAFNSCRALHSLVSHSAREGRARREGVETGASFPEHTRRQRTPCEELAWDVAVNLFLVSREARRRRGVTPRTFKLKRYSTPDAISTLHLLFIYLTPSGSRWRSSRSLF